MIIEVSVAVIAIAFTILVIYLIMLIQTLRLTFHQVDKTLSETRQQLTDIGGETKKLLGQVDHVTSDMKTKFESFNSLFNSVSNIGAVLEDKTATLRHNLVDAPDQGKGPLHSRFKSGEDVITPELSKIANVLELAGLGVRLLQKLKQRR